MIAAHYENQNATNHSTKSIKVNNIDSYHLKEILLLIIIINH